MIFVMRENRVGEVLRSSSKILYVRAALKPLARDIKVAGGVLPFLKSHIDFEELLVPHFSGARPFWRAHPSVWPPQTNSGALGKAVAKLPGAILSAHPTHAFAGIGRNVHQVLAIHDTDQACFAPIGELADRDDFSMLLLGCIDDSPGFSTVHVAQYRLGLSQRHMIRFLLRWDAQQEGKWSSIIAPEAPGCSMSFGKFYPYYEADGNLVQGKWGDVAWLFVPSARRALEVEMDVLRKNGRFVDCGRWNCLSCRVRLY